jgi:FKBP-type peptidyl-prolyl cis-trans isomerase 2
MLKKVIVAAIIVFSITIWWCRKSTNIVQTWNKVSLTYSAKFEDWDIFKDQESVDITVGSWDIIKWVEEWIIWLKQSQEKEILVTPENGYIANYDASKVQKLTKIIFDRLWIKPKIGGNYKIWNLEGIIKWTEGTWDFQVFMLDTNPRETLDNLIFKVKIEKIFK